MTLGKVMRQFRVTQDEASGYVILIGRFKPYSLFGLNTLEDLLVLLQAINEHTEPYGKSFDYQEFLSLIVSTHHLGELIYKISVRCRTAKVIEPIAEVFERHKKLNF